MQPPAERLEQSQLDVIPQRVARRPRAEPEVETERRGDRREIAERQALELLPLESPDEHPRDAGGSGHVLL